MVLTRLQQEDDTTYGNQVFKPEEYLGVYPDVPQKDNNMYAGASRIQVINFAVLSAHIHGKAYVPDSFSTGWILLRKKKVIL